MCSILVYPFTDQKLEHLIEEAKNNRVWNDENYDRRPQAGNEMNNIASIKASLPTINNQFDEKKKDFKNRKDVINKSILRAIKKFFTNWFRQEYPQPRFRKEMKRLDYFRVTLSNFILQFQSYFSHILFPTNAENSDIDIQTIFCCLIGEKKMKLLGMKQNSRLHHFTISFIEDFQQSCKSYSHSAYERLVNNPIFKVL